MNKKLTIPIPISILIIIIISVVVTIVIMNNKKPDKNPSLSPETNQSINNEETTMHKVYIDIDSKKLEIDLEDNSTASALVKMLPIALSMSDLNGNEKYAYLDKSLPTNTYSPERIEAGDVMLFGEGREDYLTRLCMVVDRRINHPEYMAKIKVIPKKDYPILMPCEF